MRPTNYMVGVMYASIKGERIQCRPVSIKDHDWIDDPNPEWNWTALDYRIKPDSDSRNIKLLECSLDELRDIIFPVILWGIPDKAVGIINNEGSGINNLVDKIIDRLRK